MLYNICNVYLIYSNIYIYICSIYHAIYIIVYIIYCNIYIYIDISMFHLPYITYIYIYVLRLWSHSVLPAGCRHLHEQEHDHCLGCWAEDLEGS